VPFSLWLHATFALMNTTIRDRNVINFTRLVLVALHIDKMYFLIVPPEGPFYQRIDKHYLNVIKIALHLKATLPFLVTVTSVSKYKRFCQFSTYKLLKCRRQGGSTIISQDGAVSYSSRCYVKLDGNDTG
jgi:hypothetical protein